MRQYFSLKILPSYRKKTLLPVVIETKMSVYLGLGRRRKTYYVSVQEVVDVVNSLPPEVRDFYFYIQGTQELTLMAAVSGENVDLYDVRKTQRRLKVLINVNDVDSPQRYPVSMQNIIILPNGTL